MPLVHKVVNSLTTHAGHHAVKCDKTMDSLLTMAVGNIKSEVRRHCRVSIITCGNNNSIGFGCTEHVDTLDKRCKKIQDNFQKKLGDQNSDSMSLTNAKLFTDMFGIGTSTTCGYIISGIDKLDPNKVRLYAYFILSGLGACVLMKSYFYHYFYGFAFSHCTAVPVVVKGNKVYYKYKDVNVFAWGGGG